MVRKPRYIKLALLLLILPALYATLTTLLEWYEGAESWKNVDGITQFEMRLWPLKSALKGEEAVGYLGDHSDPSDAEAQRNFQMAQYTLAPIMVTDKRRSRYVVSILPWTPILEQESQKQGLTLVKDFGGDLRLFERGRP